MVIVGKDRLDILSLLIEKSNNNNKKKKNSVRLMA